MFLEFLKYCLSRCEHQEVTKFMFDHDVLSIRRRELLHCKWTDRVYDPIQNHILSEIRSEGFENLLLQKRLLYNEFLAKGNRKVFDAWITDMLSIPEVFL